MAIFAREHEDLRGGSRDAHPIQAKGVGFPTFFVRGRCEYLGFSNCEDLIDVVFDSSQNFIKLNTIDEQVRIGINSQ